MGKTGFALTAPCATCPFKRAGGIRLRRERAREIARAAIDAQGQYFPCHKTVTHNDEGESVPSNDQQYCAGAIAFALNVGRVNQYLRIMERLGGWNPEAIRGRQLVFDSVAEMVNAQGRR
jgi:hypothetical protein